MPVGTVLEELASGHKCIVSHHDIYTGTSNKIAYMEITYLDGRVYYYCPEEILSNRRVFKVVYKP